MPKDITPAPDELLPIWRDIAYLCHDLFVLWSKSQAILDLHRIEIGDPEYNAVWYLLPITTGQLMGMVRDLFTGQYELLPDAFTEMATDIQALMQGHIETLYLLKARQGSSLN